MANKNEEIAYIRGKLYWAKIVGEPVDDYNKVGKEWPFDVALDSDGVKQVKGWKIGSQRLKDKDDERGKFISLKQRAQRMDYKTNTMVDAKPITIRDAAGNLWDGVTKIGNGSVADVKVKIVDYGKGDDKKGVYPLAVRILEHVPYENSDFAPLKPDDEFFREPQVEAKADTFKKDFGIEDIEEDDDIL
jgi:hypothetical protein